MGRRKKKKFDAFTVELEITDAANDGRGVARHEGQVVFIEGAVPGDRAEIWIYRKKKDILIGRLERLISPSPHRKNADCPHFDDCGGCKWQNMRYEAQLAIKEKHVKDAFERIGKLEMGEFLPILANEEPYFYRNKLEFSFSDRAWLSAEEMQLTETPDQRVLGYHKARVFDKVLNVENCLLQLPIVNDIRNAVRDFGRAQGYTFHNMRSHEGFLRNLAFRTSQQTGEIMVILVVHDDDETKIDSLFSHLEERFPEITSFIWVVNEKLNNSFTDLPYRVWKGPAFITEQLGDFQFHISPVSFFQTNPRQAQRLYDVAKNFLAETLPDGQGQHGLIYDLYSGTGSIGIYLSELTEKVVGIEYVEAATIDARKNVGLNGLENFRFFAGDMKKVLSPDFLAQEGQPDVIITDPPRQGMEPKVVEKILKILPQYIIYVSCQPATQARDLALMKEQYEILKVQPVDMFPQTAHVENVALLKQKITEEVAPD